MQVILNVKTAYCIITGVIRYQRSLGTKYLFTSAFLRYFLAAHRKNAFCVCFIIILLNYILFHKSYNNFIGIDFVIKFYV